MLTTKYSEQSEEKAKEQIATSYNLSTMIATFVGCVFDSKPIPTLNELYPETFAKELNEEEIEIKKQAILKEQLLDFAEQANKQRKLKGVN